VSTKGLTGAKKAAILLKHLKEEEIEQLTLEIAGLRKVEPELRQGIMDEFYQMGVAQNYISQGGVEYAKEILEKALGNQKALEILNRLTSTLQVRPFDAIRKTDPSQLLNFLQGENSQTIALIMAYLRPEQAAIIVAALPPDRQADVARRMALMDRTSPEIIREVEKVLEQKLSSLMTEGFAAAGGVDTVVGVLNSVDRGTERSILETLEIEDPELVEEIRKRMLVFEDIVSLDDRSVQRVLRDIDLSQDLPLALKSASDEVKEKVFKNLSSRARENIQDDMAYLGPVRLSSVEEAQQKIVNTIRRLEEEGEIILARGGGDEIIV